MKDLELNLTSRRSEPRVYKTFSSEELLKKDLFSKKSY